jgi:hypothetical protein
MSFISPPLCRTLKRLRSEPLGRHQPDGAHRMREIAHNWISPVRIKVNASQIAVATAGAAQSEDRSAKQKTTFFDSIDPKPAFEPKCSGAKRPSAFTPVPRSGFWRPLHAHVAAVGAPINSQLLLKTPKWAIVSSEP